MRKLVLITALALVSSLAQAVGIFNVDFSTYTNGNLNGAYDWVATPGSAFSVTNNELLLDNTAGTQRIMLGGTNGTSLGIGESIEISYDMRYQFPNPATRQHGRMMSFGVQTNATDASGGQSETVSGYQSFFGQELTREDGEVRYNPDSAGWWINDARNYEIVCTNLGFNPFGYNFATSNDTGVVDSNSDEVRIVYKLTKSHVTNEFDVTLSTSNLATSVSDTLTLNSVSRPGAWAGNDLHFFFDTNPEAGRDYGLYIKSVKMDRLDPVPLPPTAVNALGLDGAVSVSWTVMAGAATYDVYRTTTPGVYGAAHATGVSAQPYIDNTAVVNGTTYYYRIVAKFTNGDSAPSVESAGATPETIFSNQSIYANDFSTYALGDLASTVDWNAISGSGSNAFAVINDTGTNKADTASTEADMDAVEGNGVYIDKLLRNDADDIIEGYIDVVISVTAAPGLDADTTHQTVLTFGPTTSKSDSPKLAGKNDMALLGLRVRYENRLLVMFGEDSITEANALAIVNFDELGWNPKPNSGQSWVGNAALPQDLETDPLRVTYKFRKTREADTYQVWASVSNMTTGITYAGPSTYRTITRPDLYNSAACLFSMSHDAQANIAPRVSTLHAKVNAMSVTHGTQLPAVIAPNLTTLVSGDREVQFTWDPILEASGGYSISLLTPNGENYVLATNITATTYTDSPRWNGIVNTYTLTANYDSDLAPNTASTNFGGAPVAFLPVWHQNGAWTTGATLTQGSVVSNSPTHFYIDNLNIPMWTNGVGGYTGPTMYGLIQSARSNTTTQAYSTKMVDNTGYTPWGQWPYGNSLHFTKVSDFGYGASTSFNAAANALYIKLVAGSWSLGNTGGTDNGLRAVIRNGSQWYASDTHNVLSSPGGQSDRTVVIADAAAETWYPLSVTPATRMNPSWGSPLLDTSVLTNVNAIGWLGQKYFNLSLYEFEVQVSGALSSYDYWAQNSGLVSTNSAATDDPDMDGLINKLEYAYGGDPLVADSASLPIFDPAVQAEPGTGSNVMTYVYNQLRDPVSGITYSLLNRQNLNIGVWNPSAYNTSEEIIDYQWKAVTNYVPTTANTTFLKLDIQ